MPALILMFGAGIKYLMGYAIARFLFHLGVSYVVYQGMDVLLDNMRSQIEGDYSGLLTNIFAVVTLSGADAAISILFSAIAIRLLINGFTGGTKAGFRLTGIGGGG